tara:strand:- start:90 stop:527 length:438 start_codon:yes stop_codon:yes gene_type:complete
MNPVTEVIPNRRNALLIAIIAFGLLSISFWLTPSSSGLGTHHDLGLPQCGWIVAANLPCPTCGMTTAYAYTVRGKFISAFFAQPLGLVLALMTAIIGVFAVITACTGRSFALVYYRFSTLKYFILVCVLALLSWGFKILIHRGIL